MATLAGNVGLKISSRLLIPWISKNNAISCVKGRDYSSSFPVRYVPKKSVKIKESENSVPVKGLERNELCKQPDASGLRTEVSNSGRDVKKPLEIYEQKKSVPLNGLQRNELQKQSDASELRTEASKSGRDVKTSFASHKKFQNHNQMANNNKLLDAAKQEFGEEISCEHGLFKESEVFEEPQEVAEEMKILQQKDFYLQAAKARQDAENLAVKLLATRAFTAVEMRKKLNGKKFPSHVIEAVITDFQSRGLINDSLYAESYSRSRWSSASWGPRRIKQALFKKGISQTDAKKAVNLVFRDGESDEDQESKLGMSKHSIDHLFVQASKQWLRSQGAPKETRKSRIIHWLQYRGFNWCVTSFILKKLESQYPS